MISLQYAESSEKARDARYYATGYSRLKEADATRDNTMPVAHAALFSSAVKAAIIELPGAVSLRAYFWLSRDSACHAATHALCQHTYRLDSRRSIYLKYAKFPAVAQLVKFRLLDDELP